MIKNMFYFYNINKIGGVENFFYELSKKYSKWDIVIYYTFGDKDQIERLKKYVEVKQYNGKDTIECKKAFFNYNANIIDNVNAEKYYLIIHADYKAQHISPPIYPKITNYIGVSQAVCDSFTELTGKPCQLCYNPITIDPPKRTLHLVSATRLTSEKGKWRIEKLAKELDANHIPYIWDIYTNDKNAIKNPNIYYRTPTLDINDKLVEADYVVQLSDSESYCYTMIESLMLEVPVIVCPWPCLKELNVDERYGFILPFDMNNLPIQEIYTKEFNFKYTPPADCWDIILASGESTYKYEKETLCWVSATDAYQQLNLTDGELGRIPERGERWQTSIYRAKMLSEDNIYKKSFVHIVKDSK